MANLGTDVGLKRNRLLVLLLCFVSSKRHQSTIPPVSTARQIFCRNFFAPFRFDLAD